MAGNALGPWWMECFYVSFNGNHEHVQRVPVQGSGSWSFGGTNNVVTRGGSTLSLSTAAAGWASTMAAALPVTDFISEIDWFYQATPTSTITLAEISPVAQPGTNTIVVDLELTEAVFSFKTATRGGLKIFVMEQYLARNQKLDFADANASEWGGVIDLIMGIDGFITGRNGLYPASFLHLTTKENDHERKRKLNP